MLELLERGLGVYLVIVMTAAGIISRWTAGACYNRLLRQTENMGITKDKYLKQCKNRFENTYRIGKGMRNTQIFVERNLRELRLMGISVKSWDNFSQKLSFLSVVISAAIGGFYLNRGMDLQTCLMPLAIGFLGTLCIELFCRAVNTEEKRKGIVANITDYFENTLTHRLDNNANVIIAPEREMKKISTEKSKTAEKVIHKKPMEASVKNEDKNLENDIEYLKRSLERIAASRERGNGPLPQPTRLSEEDEKLIEEIIKEYLY